MEEGTSLTRGDPPVVVVENGTMPIDYEFPIEPLYTLKVACELIPMGSLHGLYIFLNKNRLQFEARYRKTTG